MWIRLTILNGDVVMVNLEKYGNILQNKKTPTGSILYQTDANDDYGIAVTESLDQIAAEIDRRRGEG